MKAFYPTVRLKLHSDTSEHCKLSCVTSHHFSFAILLVSEPVGLCDC